MVVLFISNDRKTFLACTIDNTDTSIALVIAPGFYLHHVEVADQNPASGSRYKQIHAFIILNWQFDVQSKSTVKIKVKVFNKQTVHPSSLLPTCLACIVMSKIRVPLPNTLMLCLRVRVPTCLSVGSISQLPSQWCWANCHSRWRTYRRSAPVAIMGLCTCDRCATSAPFSGISWGRKKQIYARSDKHRPGFWELNH